MARPMSLGEKTSLLFDLRNQKAELEAKVKDITREIEELNWEIIQGMENAGLDKMTVAEGTVSRTVKLYPSIQDKDTFINWCVEQGLPGMMVVRANEAVFREFFDQHNEYPEGLDAFEKATLNVRRSR